MNINRYMVRFSSARDSVSKNRTLLHLLISPKRTSSFQTIYFRSSPITSQTLNIFNWTHPFDLMSPSIYVHVLTTTRTSHAPRSIPCSGLQVARVALQACKQLRPISLLTTKSPTRSRVCEVEEPAHAVQSQHSLGRNDSISSSLESFCVIT